MDLLYSFHFLFLSSSLLSIFLSFLFPLWERTT